MAQGRVLRVEYLRLVRDTLRGGIEAGEFRACDVDVQSLLVFGSAQWAWTWFDPNGPATADHVGAALVDLVLGGLLTSHAALAGLVDAGGPLARTVHACIADAAEPQSAAS